MKASWTKAGGIPEGCLPLYQGPPWAGEYGR